MGFFIGIIIVAIAIGCGIWAACSFDNCNLVMGTVATVLCIASIIAFIIVPFSFHTVETGEVAVVKQFGEAREVKAPGLNYNFWGTHKFVYIDTKVQDLGIETMAYSSDAQTMTVFMNVQFQVQADKAIDIVKTYGTLEALTSRISSIVTEQPKAVLSTHTAMDIIANRTTITPAVEEAIRVAIGDEYFVSIVTVTITNIDFSDAFEQAVEDKMIAEQAKLKAEYENETKVAQAKAEAEASVKKAEGEAEAKLKAAQAKIEIEKANAEALKIAAEGEAAANKIVTESITQELLDKIIAEGWNGELPLVVGGNGEYILPSEVFGE